MPLDSYDNKPTNNPGIARRNSAAVTLELALKVQLVQAMHLGVKIDAVESGGKATKAMVDVLRQWCIYQEAGRGIFSGFYRDLKRLS